MHGSSLVPSRSAKRVFFSQKPISRYYLMLKPCKPQMIDAKDRSSCRKPHGDICGTMCFVSFVQSTFWLMSHIFVHLCCKNTLPQVSFQSNFGCKHKHLFCLLVDQLHNKVEEYSIKIFTTVFFSLSLNYFESWIMNMWYVCLFLSGSETTFAQTG